jgi:hypothetical protein
MEYKTGQANNTVDDGADERSGIGWTTRVGGRRQDVMKLGILGLMDVRHRQSRARP